MWVKIKDRSELVEGDKYKSIDGKVWTLKQVFSDEVWAAQDTGNFINNHLRWGENEWVENEPKNTGLEGTGLEGTIFDDSSKEKGFID